MKTASCFPPRAAAALVSAVLSGACCAASGEGLTPDVDSIGWSRWQGRISLVTAAPAWRADLASGDNSGLSFGSARLLGDYYFSSRDLRTGTAGGFRATSGLLVGSRLTPWSPTLGASGTGISVERRVLAASAVDNGTVPYVGLGWSGASLRSGWAFSADLGVMSLNPGGAVKFGRVLGNLQNLDDVLRDMRLSPMLQLGVSYSF